MVALNTLLTLAAAVAPLANGAAVPPQDSSLAKRQYQIPSWDKYHEQNEAFSRQGLCLIYIDPSPRDGTWACGVWCKNENTRICTGGGVPLDQRRPDELRRNPDGELYAIGKCECDTKAVEYLASATVDFVGKGLDAGFREIASVSCEIMLNVMKEAVIAGTYAIPGAGQYAASARAVAKGVRLAAKSKDGKSLWKEAVQSSCDFRKSEDLDEIDQGFGVFEGSPDDFE
ncbi:hypothetical protein FLONG3_1095 [Fusarium longipes]|uniref:Uncharacterized protein n=1 Tax=Fusarium longipes TaxID=694270 RepID=A0A395T954_9HYPO|nr:hypothetical protein FLONG3_1095 [Fusarium longipes]